MSTPNATQGTNTDLLRFTIRVRAHQIILVQVDGRPPQSEEEIEDLQIQRQMTNIMEGPLPDGDYIVRVDNKRQRSLQLPEGAKHRHFEFLSYLDTIMIRPLLKQLGHGDVLDIFTGPGHDGPWSTKRSTPGDQARGS